MHRDPRNYMTEDANNSGTLKRIDQKVPNKIMFILGKEAGEGLPSKIKYLNNFSTSAKHHKRIFGPISPIPAKAKWGAWAPTAGQDVASYPSTPTHLRRCQRRPSMEPELSSLSDWKQHLLPWCEWAAVTTQSATLSLLEISGGLVRVRSSPSLPAVTRSVLTSLCVLTEAELGNKTSTPTWQEQRDIPLSSPVRKM